MESLEEDEPSLTLHLPVISELYVCHLNGYNYPPIEIENALLTHYFRESRTIHKNGYIYSSTLDQRECCKYIVNEEYEICGDEVCGLIVYPYYIVDVVRGAESRTNKGNNYLQEDVSIEDSVPYGITSPNSSKVILEGHIGLSPLSTLSRYQHVVRCIKDYFHLPARRAVDSLKHSHHNLESDTSADLVPEQSLYSERLKYIMLPLPKGRKDGKVLYCLSIERTDPTSIGASGRRDKIRRGLNEYITLCDEIYSAYEDFSSDLMRALTPKFSQLNNSGIDPILITLENNMQGNLMDVEAVVQHLAGTLGYNFLMLETRYRLFHYNRTKLLLFNTNYKCSVLL